MSACCTWAVELRHLDNSYTDFISSIPVSCSSNGEVWLFQTSLTWGIFHFLISWWTCTQWEIRTLKIVMLLEGFFPFSVLYFRSILGNLSNSWVPRNILFLCAWMNFMFMMPQWGSWEGEKKKACRRRCKSVIIWIKIIPLQNIMALEYFCWHVLNCMGYDMDYCWFWK